MAKKQIKLSEVIELIDEGKRRPEIQEYYGLSGKEMAALFQHPQLKNRRARKPVELSFELVEDVEEDSISNEFPEEEIIEELPVEEEAFRELPVEEEIIEEVVEETNPTTENLEISENTEEEAKVEPLNIDSLPESIWK